MKRELVFPNLSRKLAAEAWTKRKTKKIPMDVRLAEAFTEISKPNLGCATTGKLISELRARSDLRYSTVFSEREEKSLPNTK